MGIDLSSILEEPVPVKDLISREGGNEQTTSSTEQVSSSSHYAGDFIDDSGPLKDTGYQCMAFDTPALMLAFYNQDIANGNITLHKWQTEQLEELATSKPSAQHPYKLCLLTCNGSGKDCMIIAGFSCWFALCKIKSRCIITSASGVQLTAQTETYIKDFAAMVNAFHGCEIFRIRQRYIKCLLSGSEIRLFATDEKGRAEGYHPWGTGEMAIIVNEGKSVSEDIHSALKRCTGYNYWLEVSSTGEPSGFLYKAFTTWPHTRRVTAYDCPHISVDEIESDKRELGEHSALFRSIYLALFTTTGTDTIIPQELLNEIIKLAKDNNLPTYTLKDSEIRVGLDLAAGGDENSICFCKHAKCIKQVHFREVDTEITADRVEIELKAAGITKKHKHIYADDGGVGRSIIDKLVRRGWTINRVMNQWSAIRKKAFGNRGAENWFRVKRIVEEKIFDVSTLDEKTQLQIYTRHFRPQLVGGRMFLESKKQAIADGRPSPDRADAWILSLTGLTLEDYLSSQDDKSVDKRPKTVLTTQQEVQEHYENEVTYTNYTKKPTAPRRLYNSLRAALSRN